MSDPPGLPRCHAQARWRIASAPSGVVGDIRVQTPPRFGFWHCFFFCVGCVAGSCVMLLGYHDSGDNENVNIRPEPPQCPQPWPLVLTHLLVAERMSCWWNVPCNPCVDDPVLPRGTHNMPTHVFGLLLASPLSFPGGCRIKGIWTRWINLDREHVSLPLVTLFIQLYS